MGAREGRAQVVVGCDAHRGPVVGECARPACLASALAPCGTAAARDVSLPGTASHAARPAALAGTTLCGQAWRPSAPAVFVCCLADCSPAVAPPACRRACVACLPQATLLRAASSSACSCWATSRSTAWWVGDPAVQAVQRCCAAACRQHAAHSAERCAALPRTRRLPPTPSTTTRVCVRLALRPGLQHRGCLGD